MELLLPIIQDWRDRDYSVYRACWLATSRLIKSTFITEWAFSRREKEKWREKKKTKSCRERGDQPRWVCPPPPPPSPPPRGEHRRNLKNKRTTHIGNWEFHRLWGKRAISKSWLFSFYSGHDTAPPLFKLRGFFFNKGRDGKRSESPLTIKRVRSVVPSR